MKSIKQLMQEMGFNKESSLDTQKAFVKHLIAAANQTAPTPLQKPRSDKGPIQNPTVAMSEPPGKQLEFIFPEDKQVS